MMEHVLEEHEEVMMDHYNGTKRTRTVEVKEEPLIDVVASKLNSDGR